MCVEDQSCKQRFEEDLQGKFHVQILKAFLKEFVTKEEKKAFVDFCELIRNEAIT